MLFAIAALSINTMMVIFAASQGNLQDKSVTNMNRHYQAREAAQAGLNYGITYLQKNGSTITASPVGGFIQPYTSTNTTNVTLANNSSFTITYSNPVANNYNLILVTSIGSSDDGSAVKTVSQLIEGADLGLAGSADVPLLARGIADYAGNGTVINTYTNNTIRTGGSVDLKGNATTQTSDGVSSTAAALGTDISANESELSSMSNDQFFTEVMGDSPTNIQSNADLHFSNNGTTNYNTDLDGVTNSVIWIDQSNGKAILNANSVIGSPTEPVVLVVNGGAQFTGNTVIYGFVFVLGDEDLDLAGNVIINGGVSTTNNVVARGNSQIIYNPAILRDIHVGPSTTTYTRVPGSWKDF